MRARVIADQRLVEALKRFRSGESLSKAAGLAHVSHRRFRRFVEGHAFARKKGRRWVPIKKKGRGVTIYSRGEAVELMVPTRADRRLAGACWFAAGDAVRRRRGSRARLAEFEGLGVYDLEGRFHPFDTDLATLTRLSQTHDLEFHQTYRNVA